MRRPTYFDIPASDTTRAISFYSRLFGWNFARGNGTPEYWVITQASPNDQEVIGGLAPRDGIFPGRPELNGFINAFVCSFPVVDIDVTLHTVAELGGITFMAKVRIPGVGWRALVKDTEGNVFGLIQYKPLH